MKKTLAFAFTLLLGASLAFAQNRDIDKSGKESGKSGKISKTHKGGKKAPKGGQGEQHK